MYQNIWVKISYGFTKNIVVDINLKIFQIKMYKINININTIINIKYQYKYQYN